MALLLSDNIRIWSCKWNEISSLPKSRRTPNEAQQQQHILNPSLNNIRHPLISRYESLFLSLPLSKASIHLSQSSLSLLSLYLSIYHHDFFQSHQIKYHRSTRGAQKAEQINHPTPTHHTHPFSLSHSIRFSSISSPDSDTSTCSSTEIPAAESGGDYYGSSALQSIYLIKWYAVLLGSCCCSWWVIFSGYVMKGVLFPTYSNLSLLLVNNNIKGL